ncbi:Death-inducer obliterator 1 [Eumeta japonica]|uniref:Death-inducer obliterator 1 n=1 Tax=Eumeta variegata TaxID=151549 RepID=A0A4C1VLR0_EUMVA|nr:Death-inducer obliterator 1 [Eumeta japonica]
MSNTVITNYTDLNGPSTKADSSVVVIVNKDGSLSIDEKLLSAFMNSDGSQGTGISVVRVGHDGRPDDATDSETEDDSVPHVTLSVDSYYDEPNSIVKYESGAEMLQSLRLETRENSLLGFQNDHCYTPHTISNKSLPPRESFPGYDEPILEIKSQNPTKTSIPVSKKITILEQHIIPIGKKIVINPADASVILKGSDVLSKPLPSVNKPKLISDQETTGINAETKTSKFSEENADSTSVSSSGDSVPDRDSDSDYKDTQQKAILSKSKQKIRSRPRILKSTQALKVTKERVDNKLRVKTRNPKTFVKKEIKEKILQKNVSVQEKKQDIKSKEDDVSTLMIGSVIANNEQKQIPKISKKEKKTPAHMSALLSDMTSLFSSPDVIRRVSTDNKSQTKQDKITPVIKKAIDTSKNVNNQEESDSNKVIENKEKVKDSQQPLQKSNLVLKSKVIYADKMSKPYEPIPQLDEASLAQILQDTTPAPSVPKTNISTSSIKDTYNPSSNTMNSPSLAGPLSPTLELLGGLQPEEEGLTEDLLMHVAQLVESSENLQEVIDKQVLGKVDSNSVKPNIPPHYQQAHSQTNIYNQSTPKSSKSVAPRKDPIEIIRKDGRVITLPPIEAPATRASKRKSQLVSSQNETPVEQYSSTPAPKTPEPQFVQQSVPRHYVNKKLANKKQESPATVPSISKLSAESEESWNSEDDPDRLWCICKQPHNNRFMICCDRCEDWFHGKCVNITKAMGQQMEQQGIEWTCPNCIKKTQTPKPTSKSQSLLKKQDSEENKIPRRKSADVKNTGSKTNCIVCKKEARANSIYCSDVCIRKYVHDSLGSQVPLNKSDDSGKTLTKQSDSKVIVFERTTGKCLDGANAPTAENLKSWLQKNPTFEVVRPGSLSAIKPNSNVKKPHPQKVQTILNFERIHKRAITTPESLSKTQNQIEPKVIKSPTISKEDGIKKITNRIPVTPKQNIETVKAVTPKTPPEVKKPTRTFQKQQSIEKSTITTEKMTTPKKKEKEPEAKGRSNSSEPIRENVRKSLQEQMQIRVSENEGLKFSDEEVHNFAVETEAELHELFRDVGVKYKAKYRSLMFNIKDRKNLSLWEKICNREITPKQLVRLSPEELASQELAQWRDKEAKHQLELIKKSELDLLAANKTYVLKTHKGEEVMETKKSVSTELDPNVPVEDVVTALNDSTVIEDTSQPENPKNSPQHVDKKSPDGDRRSSRRKEKEERSKTRSKKSSKHSKLDDEHKPSSKKIHTKKISENITHRQEKKQSRTTSSSKDRRHSDSQSLGLSKRKSHSQERSRRRSHSRTKSKPRSKSREHSRTRSRSRVRSSQRERSSSRASKHRSLSGEIQSKQRSSSREMKTTQRSMSREMRSKQRSSSRETRSKQRSSSREIRTKQRSTSRDMPCSQRSSFQETRSKQRSLSRETRSKQRSISRETRSKKRSTSRETRSKKRSTSRETRSKKRSISRETRSKKRSTSRETRSKKRSISRETRSRQRSSSREMRSKFRSRSKHRTQSIEPRSHSQENNQLEKKYEEPVERPKSAMLNEVHPEYDPHERMITSAVSEEDLHKSRDDMYEDGYSYEVTPNASKIPSDYDPVKTFTITSSSRTIRSNSMGKEAESDQEPSSTVDMSAMVVWSGCINMVDVARLYVAAYEVSGYGADLEEDLNAELEIVGRINPDTVWDYITKMKRTGNKDIVILRLSAANDEEKMPYIALYSYLSSRNRLGVVKVSNTTTVKDFYILPLPANSSMPQVLLPLEGPGLEEVRTPLLIGIVIRQRKKRAAPTIPKDIIPAKVARESRNRSYTPPVAKTYTPPASPRRRAPLPIPLPVPYTSPALSTSVKDKIAASLACADGEEAYSPGSVSSGESAPESATSAAPATDVLRSKMEELNRQIEEQKQQIRKMKQADGDDEAYSPSRPMSPPSMVPLADIALPSNLQEILATIKQRSEVGAGVSGLPLADVDMRTPYTPTGLPPPPGPL